MSGRTEAAGPLPLPHADQLPLPLRRRGAQLAKHGLEYRTERVPYSRKDRPEIVELTKQSRVPVLVDGDEVIHDSKRIRQYLDSGMRPTMNNLRLLRSLTGMCGDTGRRYHYVKR